MFQVLQIVVKNRCLFYSIRKRLFSNIHFIPWDRLHGRICTQNCTQNLYTYSLIGLRGLQGHSHVMKVKELLNSSFAVTVFLDMVSVQLISMVVAAEYLPASLELVTPVISQPKIEFVALRPQLLVLTMLWHTCHT